MMKKIIFLMVLLLGIAPLPATENGNTQRAGAILLSVNQLRKIGSTSGDQIVQRLFSEEAQKKWNSETAQTFLKEQISDFFTGAVFFVGSIQKNRCICAFYNCWWDAILLCDCYFEEVSAEKIRFSVMKISDYQFLDGGIFRKQKKKAGEKEKNLDSLPLIVQCMRKMQMSEKEFMNRAGEFALNGLPEPDSEEANIKALQIHSAVRLKRRVLLLRNRSAFLESEGLRKLLAQGSEKRFKLYFPTELSQMMGKSFCSLPSAARSEFILCDSALPEGKSRERMYVFLNREAPKFAVFFHLGMKSQKNQFYYFDMSNYDEFLKICDMAEKGRKK